MPKLKLILFLTAFALIPFAGYQGFESYKLSNEKACINIKYNSYRTFHFTAITMNELSKNPEHRFREKNIFLFNLYRKFESDKNKPNGNSSIEGLDYRLGFKPCNEKRWAFFALNRVVFLDNNFYSLVKADVDSLVNTMDRWEKEKS